MFNMERYFKQVDSPFLPPAHGESSRFVPSKSIKEGSSQKRQNHQKVSTEIKSKIAKYATENGV